MRVAAAVLALVAAGSGAAADAAAADAAADADEMPSVRQMWSRWYSVQAVAQTEDGFIWVATDDALERFDGRRFQSYAVTARPTPRDRIVTLAAAPGGAVYVALADGRVARVRPGDEALELLNGGAPLAPGTPTAIAVTSADRLWLGNAQGLWQWDVVPGGAGAGAVRAPDGPSGGVDGLARGADGRDDLWVAAGAALYKRSAAGFERVRLQPAPGRISAMTTHRGGLWISVAGERTALYHLVADRAPERIPLPERDGMPPPRALAAGDDGALWFIGDEGDLVRLKGGGFSRRPLAFSTRALMIDREGSIWAATWTGLARIARSRTQVFLGFQEGAGGRSAIAVLEARDGTVWASLQDGLLRIRGRDVQRLGREELQGLVCFRSLAEASDADGTLWAPTCRGGVLRLSRGIATAFGEQHGLPREGLGGVAVDGEGVVWVTGARGGLFTLRAGRFVAEAAFERTVIRTVLTARGGGLWLGVPGEGLIRYRAGRIDRFGAAEGLDRPQVNTVVESARSDGGLWVGVRGGGLYRFTGGRFQPLDERAGFQARNVHGLVEDGRGDLWVTTDTGLYHLPRADVDAFYAGRRASVRAFRYGVEDGFETERFSDGFSPAAARGRDGRLWFPTISGLVALRAPESEPPLPSPALVFEEVRIGSRGLRLRAGAPVRATADAGDLAVRFTAPTFATPHRVRFQYRLDAAGAGRGEPAAWSDAEEDRVARFPSVAPGRYTFRLRARTDDFGGQQTEAALSIDLARPLRDWLYPSAGVLAASLLAFAAQRFRVRRARRQFDAVLAERNRIARDLHDTLAQGFAGIGYQVEHLEQARADPAEVDRSLKTLRTLVRVCRMEARQAIWNLRAEAPESRPVTERLRETAEQAGLSSAAIVELAVEGEPRALPAAAEQELVRVAQEAMTNALVHGRAQRIDVRLAFAGEAVTLEVRDSGAGFDPGVAAQPAAGHFGLQGMKERAARLGATLDIDGEPGKGACIRLVIPHTSSGLSRRPWLARLVKRRALNDRRRSGPL